MAHNDAPPSKAIKLTPEEDINSEEILDTVRSVASSKGKDVAVIPCIRNCIRIYFIYILPQMSNAFQYIYLYSINWIFLFFQFKSMMK